MQRVRFFQRSGAIAVAAALVMGAPVAALADGGPGGNAECSSLQILVHGHPGWATAFPVFGERLKKCGLPFAGPHGHGDKGGDQSKHKGAATPPAPPPPAQAPAPGPVQFQDLGGYTWAQADITLLAQLGLVNGVGNDRFAPGQEITRVQFAELMQRLFNLPQPSATTSFVDVTSSTPGYGAIEAAAPYMTEFNTPGGVAFEPNLPEVRIEVAATIGELEVAEHLATLPAASTAAQVWSQFTDGSHVPSGLLQASAVAVQQGLMKGYPNGSFGVDQTLTRAQAAVLLVRLLQGSETIGTTTTTSSTAPQVTGIAPSSGPAAGGTTVTITGSNFASGAQVLFGATASPSVTYVSADELQAVSPAGTGTVDVLVADASGTSAAVGADQFTYTAAAPAVAGISPSSGPTSGGTTVTITGSNFASDAQVLFGATAASSVTFIDAGVLQAVAPPSATTGAVNVSVVQPSGTSPATGADAFTYTTATTPPSSSLSVSGISPSSGSVGSSILISGTGFTSGAAVYFGSTQSSNVTVYNPTTITAQVPSGSGTVSVSVYENGGSATNASAQFTYN